MSTIDATPEKPLPWTDEAKVQFLLRIIAQLRGDGKTMNWAKINIPGRTTKSLQNMWTKINKEITDMEAAENGEDGETMIKPKASTPARKARAKKAEKSSPTIAPGASDDDEDGNDKRPVTPKKRAQASRAAGNSAAKRIKKADFEKQLEILITEDSDRGSGVEI